jgi:predicted dehydrogenase
MAGEKVRVGIIGVGQIGKHHIENYKRIPDVEIVAIADINEAEAKRVSEVYGIPYYYTDFRELLKRDDIIAVDVCLHNNLHMPVTVEALQAGKHVYCEKPMAGSYRDAEYMWQAAQETGRMLSIQLSTLFSRETKVAKILIDEGKLGKIYFARSTGFRRRGRPYVDGYGTYYFVKKEYAGGGALYDTGVYNISNILYLAGNPVVERISGKTFQETPMDEKRREISGYDVEELAVGLVKCKDGFTLDIIEAWAIHLDNFESSFIVGSLGGIRLNPFGFFTSEGDLSFNCSVDLGEADWRWHTLRENADAYDSPQQHWVAALKGRVPLLPTAEIALNTMLISEGIYLSNDLGREVTAEEVRQLSKSTALKV